MAVQQLHPSTTTQRNRPNVVRESMPDQLRGIALLGIILINIFCFSFGSFNSSEVEPGTDTVVKVVLQVFVYGKFFLLFSFLFGYSMKFIIGDGSASRMRSAKRRLVALGTIGLLHGAFLFTWDILFGYAVLGAILLLLNRFRTRVLLLAAVGTALFSIVVGVLAHVFLSEIGPASLKPLYEGDFVTAHIAQLSAYPFTVIDEATNQWPLALTAMLLGLAAGRINALRNPASWVGSAKRIVFIATPIGLALVSTGLLFRYDIVGEGLNETVETALRFACGDIGALILAGAYIAGFGWALAAGLRLPEFVTSAGRCSLTIYLTMSALMVAIFASWTLGFYGQISVLTTVGIACAIWLGLAIGAHWWLKNHPAGPLEGLMAMWTKS